MDCIICFVLILVPYDWTTRSGVLQVGMNLMPYISVIDLVVFVATDKPFFEIECENDV